MSDPILTIDQARRFYVAGDAAHDFDHVLRVTELAARIAAAEGADATVVRLAALLHDVPVDALDGGEYSLAARKDHHLAAADFAAQLLAGRGVEKDVIDNVAHCIEAHRFRDQSIQPATLEAQCLYDADKLDSIGAIGVARAYAFAGAHDSRLWTQPVVDVPPDDEKPEGADYTPVHEFVYKLQRLLATLHTPTAQRIGAERHEAMVDFYDQLDAEMMGRA